MSVFIIAEVGINHNGEIDIAKKMILKAKECGADCVKFQTFKAEEFVSDPKQTYTYKSQGKEITESMLEMFKRYQFSEDEWKEIINFCNANDIVFCSTAQNYSDLTFLLSVTNLPFIKVGSDDLTNLQMLKKYALHGKKMIISAGMAYASEIEDAVEAIRSVGNEDITVLHCVSSYPAAASEVNLKKIPTIRNCFNVEVGYSDHTIGSSAAVGAVCFGATVIEKHFTLDNNMAGPDHWFASNIYDFKKYVDDIRNIELNIGHPILKPTEKEVEMRLTMQRKIVYKSNFRAGHVLTTDDFEFKRSVAGFPPKAIDFFNGRKLTINVMKNKPVQLDDL